jgi:hypothetical protein
VTDEDQTIEKLVLVRLARLNALIIGLVVGILLGLGLFIVTIVLVIKGGEVVGPHLGLLGQVFIGYEVTWAGSFIGLLYGIAAGFIAGYFFSRLYNWLAIMREQNRASG